jgi:hypothetical protein
MEEEKPQGSGPQKESGDVSEEGGPQAAPDGSIDVPKQYDTNRAKYAEAVFDCIYVSGRTGGRNAGERCYWASVLFTKFTVTAISLLKLLPARRESGTETTEEPSFRIAIRNNWDFTAIAALSRTLFENVITLFYLCFDSIDEDEWLCRLNLMQLHDFITRRKTWHTGEPQSQDTAHVVDDLHKKLNGRAYFNSLTPKKRTEFLRGTKIHFLSHEEILKRMGKTDVEGYVKLWHWWSSYAHSFPMSYYRMAEQARGGGIQNNQDLLYIGGSLEVVNELVTDSTTGMRKLFPYIESPAHYLKDALSRRPGAAKVGAEDPPPLPKDKSGASE